MRAKGFREDQSEGAPLCRWIVNSEGIDYLVDVMPCDETILGFTNRWYTDAIKYPNKIKLDNGVEIGIVTPLFFLATKFEAFHGRAEGNYFSHDMEDIIFVMEHRSDLMREFLDGTEELRLYLSEQASLLLCSEFRNVLPGMVDNPDSSKSVYRLLEFISRNGS